MQFFASQCSLHRVVITAIHGLMNREQVELTGMVQQSFGNYSIQSKTH